MKTELKCSGERQEQLVKIMEKHKDEINKNVYLPLLIECLVEGGLDFFDDARTMIELAGLNLKDSDFTRLK